MGVAEGVVDVCESGVGAKMIMHHHSAREPFWNVAARRADPVERMVLARGRVQPLRFAGDPEAVLSIVEGSSRWRTLACPMRSPIAQYALSRSSAFLRAHAVRLAGQTCGAPMRSESVCAVRSSGTSCWTLRETAAARMGSPYCVGEITRLGNSARLTPRQWGRRKSRPGARSPRSAARAGRTFGASPCLSASTRSAPPDNGGRPRPHAERPDPASPPA